MSYGLALTGDALFDLQELQTPFQEEVLDELDRITSDPSLIQAHHPGGTAIHDVVWKHAGTKHYAFITVPRDDDRQQIRVLGIAHFERPETET